MLGWDGVRRRDGLEAERKEVTVKTRSGDWERRCFNETIITGNMATTRVHLPFVRAKLISSPSLPLPLYLGEETMLLGKDIDLRDLVS